ncbi:MAG: hypothetical protein PHN37_03295, partial [Candidatus Pacebacteria bacterium]|nr:hypothetical protein [Candidatus Paceibacterota bacterium]
MKKGIKIFKKIMLGFLGLIVIIVILSVVFGEENKETPNTKEENTQNVSKQLTEEDKIKKIIKDTIKLKTNLENYPDRVKQIIINGTDSKFISITLVANNNWNNNYIKLGIFKDTAEVMHKLSQVYDNLNEVRFFWKFPLVDE